MPVTWRKKSWQKVCSWTKKWPELRARGETWDIRTVWRPTPVTSCGDMNHRKLHPSSPAPSLIFKSEMKHSKDKWTGWVRKYAFYLSLRGRHHAAHPPPEQFILTQQKQSHASNQLNFKPYCFILFAAISTLKFISCIPCRAGANNYLRHEIMLIHGLKTRAFFT